MKLVKIVTLIALVTFGYSQTNAQNANANITLTKVVETSADNVWGKLRQMDDIDQYSSIINKVEWTGAKGTGGTRVCTSADGQGKFKESILSFDDTNRTYTYAVLEGVPAMGMVNNFKVVDLGYNKSMIVWTSSYDKFMQNPQMNEEQFKGFLNQASGEMIANIAKASTK